MSRLQDRLARCSNSFYPVFVTNFTPWADPVRQENPRQTQGPPTSEEYINFPNFVKYLRIIFSGILCISSCEFHSKLWKSEVRFLWVDLPERGRVYPLLCLKNSTWRSRLAASSRVL